jgi:glycosyltransferase involved in cell wall biosynthesis
VPLVFVNLLQYTGKKGGMETYARELYREFGRFDSEFTFVGFGSREFMELDYSWFPGTVIDSGISGENRFTWARGELFAVSRAAHKAGADLIHGPSMFGPLRSRIPVVISVHDLLYFTNPEFMSTPLYTEPVKWMEKRGAKTASRIISISQVSVDSIRRYLDFPADRIDLIPLAGTPRATPARTFTREIDHFLAVGQRRPHKNFEGLLRGFAAIPREQRPRLTITGSYGEDPLRPLVSQLGLDDTVELKGWIERDELEELMGTATALIDASLVTGFSLPTLEAMLDGLPVVLAGTPVFREVGGTAARYFDPEDPESIAQAVLEVASDPALQARMADEGRVHAARYSWNRVANETLDSFRAALASPR